jgi:Rps23 Pro-64 3,4-dihydroxylase Tpa1-like proline 4-hydroxylase
MNLESYIRIYDNALPVENISSIIKYSLKQKFTPAGVGKDNIVNKEIRNVESLSLTEWDCNSKTKIHWCNYLGYFFKNNFEKYSKEVSPEIGTSMSTISSLEILKYQEGGLYQTHIDHFSNNPRILSAILLLNNDYKGGELEFFNPTTEELIVKVEVKPGRLIIWPSCFLYPHRVKPIKKGTRYSIISWAS